MQHTIVATGTTSGFGAIATQHLLADPTVTVATHHRTTAHDPHPRLHDRPVDLADLTAVASWADEIATALRGGDLPPLVAIVGNAGVQVPRGPQVSAQGLELTIAVNHLAHVLLVDRLADLLPDGGRVIITSSGTHRGDALSRLFGIRPPRLEPVARMADLASVEATRAEGMRRYATSKLANALHVLALAEEHPGLTVLAFDPGLVPGTGLVRHSPRPAQIAWRRLAPLLRLLPGAMPAEVSGRELADLARGTGQTPPSGSYVEAGRGVRPAAAAARDHAAARRLLTESRELLRAHGTPGVDRTTADGEVPDRGP